MTSQIPNCPQPESPLRERAYTAAQLAEMDAADHDSMQHIARMRAATDDLMQHASPNPYPLPVGHWRDQPASARVGTAQTPADGNT